VKRYLLMLLLAGCGLPTGQGSLPLGAECITYDSQCGEGLKCCQFATDTAPIMRCAPYIEEYSNQRCPAYMDGGGGIGP
jgi:hypothetical protein